MQVNTTFPLERNMIKHNKKTLQGTIKLPFETSVLVFCIFSENGQEQ